VLTHFSGGSVARQTLGIALGGGGAKGLAHIPLLKKIEEFDYDIAAISGTSIGAIIGSLYASGLKADGVHEAIVSILATPKTFKEAISAERKFGWLELLDLELGKNSLLNAESFIAELGQIIGVECFEDLPIPLKVVATDFWNGEPVVFDSGPLMPAVAASFCIPGMFKPVMIDGIAMVDGGSVNPVPFDLIQGACDFTVAIDVLGTREKPDDNIPSISDALFHTFQIAECAIVREKRNNREPDIFIEAVIGDTKILDFHKSEKIFEQAQPWCIELQKQLTALQSN
jgi:NTE family protein